MIRVICLDYMPAITKKETRLKLQFVANTDHSIHAGLVAVEAMARRFDFWNKVRQVSSLDPRTDKKRGYGPEVIIRQLIYVLCSSGGVSPTVRRSMTLRWRANCSAWGSLPINPRLVSGCASNPMKG